MPAWLRATGICVAEFVGFFGTCAVLYVAFMSGGVLLADQMRGERPALMVQTGASR